ncbi:MAG: nucleotidyltransferase family protein [Thermodesulfobacteriota bacterium]
MKARIEIPKERLADFCRRNHVRRLAFFGSVLRDDFTPESDVDVLVEFEHGTRIGLIRFAGVENEMSKMLGRKVDLNTAGCLSPYFRDEVLKEVEVAYEQA